MQPAPPFPFRLRASVSLLLGFLSVAQGATLPMPGADSPIPGRPNILWLSVEDMSPHLGCYGDSAVATPNIDRLAKLGIRYTRVFTTAGVCAPSRNAIITGRMQTSNGGHNMRTMNNTYPEQTGLPKSYSVVMPKGVRHMAEYLREQGYFCTNNAKTDYQFEDAPFFWDENGQKAHYAHRRKGQPFFAVFNSNITHESQVWERARRPLRVDPSKVRVPPIYPDTDSVRLDIARFLTNISEMDDWVGERLRELEASGEWENTVIMFWSDHGDGLPWVKREVTVRGIRIPLVIRMPGGPSGVTDDRLLTSLDFAPTALSLAGIPTPRNMQGHAFLGRYATDKENEYVFAARDRLDSHYDRVRSVFDGRFQYLHNFFPEKPYYMDLAYRRQQPSMREILRLRAAGGLDSIQARWFLPKMRREELYDLSTDPWQLHDLSDDPAYAGELKRLRRTFQRWQRKIPDLGQLQERRMVADMWEGGEAPPGTASPTALVRNGRLRLSCPTPGARIAYRRTGKKEEEAGWTIYTSPLKLDEGEEIRAVAHRIGYKTSPETSHRAGAETAFPAGRRREK